MAKARRQIDVNLPGIFVGGPAANLPAQATNNELDAGTETNLRSFSPANILRMLRRLVRWQDVTGKPELWQRGPLFLQAQFSASANQYNLTVAQARGAFEIEVNKVFSFTGDTFFVGLPENGSWLFLNASNKIVRPYALGHTLGVNTQPPIPSGRSALVTRSGLNVHGRITSYPAMANVTGSLPWSRVTGNVPYSRVSGGPPASAEQNVRSDWNATSGDAQILNKPSISLAWQNSSGVTQAQRIHTIRVN